MANNTVSGSKLLVRHRCDAYTFATDIRSDTAAHYFTFLLYVDLSQHFGIPFHFIHNA